MAVDDAEQFVCLAEVGFLIFNSPSLFFLRTYIHLLLTTHKIVSLLDCLSRAIPDLLESRSWPNLRYCHGTCRERVSESKEQYLF